MSVESFFTIVAYIFNLRTSVVRFRIYIYLCMLDLLCRKVCILLNKDDEFDQL